MTKLVSVAEMQAIEREANAGGLTYELMMENAGSGLADVVADTCAEIKEGGVLGLVGSGNNGGDTLVALSRLATQGWRASAYLVKPRPEDDPLVTRLVEAGGILYQAEDDAEYQQLDTLLESYSVLLDGVLGTGVSLPLKGKVAEVLDHTLHSLGEMEAPPFVVAVDCPSGVNNDTGEAAEECLPADLTVTMAAVKKGLLAFPAYELVGDLQVIDIGLPEGGEGITAWREVKHSVPSGEDIAAILPERPLDAHKGTFGTAMIIAGSTNFTGAALLAGKAAYRSGAGLVTLGVPTPLHTALAGQLPEATWLILPDEMGVIAEEAAGIVQKNLERVTAMLIGPGFGMEETTAAFLSRLIKPGGLHAKAGIGFMRANSGEEKDARVNLPSLVVDADGLKLMAQIEGWADQLPSEAVLTPHPGEMAILTGLKIADIQADRMGIATRFSREWGHVVVLKGAFSVVAAPDGKAAVIPVATPALARAGTGDVLSGLIAGLRAQGVPAYESALAGAWIHAQAGLQAAAYLGSSAAVLAGDVLEAIVDVLAEMEDA